MINYAYIALAFAVLGFVQWYSSNQYDSGLNACKAEYAVKLTDAVHSAKETEKTRSASISKASQVQYDEISAINANLLNDLDELRKRPERTDMPRDSAINCAGANGAELAREHAKFSVQYGAKAATQDAALAACYSWADSLVD